ncbi:hypothetical protein AGABI1DRAFT_93443 [Agaricus bisporus var. burnettii JB137-S8]|uniref:Uncharacterized protein n=1 Tax=Agaricus bisporus var. burnettii (strain JB137-S8 / ATCC MYA-4627 / FGSC 10392) TaxID=597362 RepID=K5X361_AGABU|nr:uncharacterized protein AGABI1DRAFT_93443 [Agaricus bisporus var. burnettii JB137-S8]EKM77367.1 hypothetical protein AGABI1DRAFT_93443 [Agaricus bisporus var. burnettii JB137-S8]
MLTIAASNITPGPSAYEAVATSHPLVQAALARLSDKDHDVLAEFREEFTNLVPEEMAKVANSFMLYRSLYVQKAKEQNPNGNQADYSRDAAIYWKYSVAGADKAHYRRWHFRIKAIWKKMYPNGFPSSTLRKKKKRQNDKPATKKVKKSSSSRPSSFKKFQPLPSPPVSDVYFSERTDSEEICDTISEDDPMDDDYLPDKPSRKRNPRRSPSEQRLEPDLLTPVSMIRELSPDCCSHFPSSMPVFCDSDSNFSFTPFPCDVNLSELNGDCPSMFKDSLLFSSPSPSAHCPREVGSVSEQPATGYSLDWSIGEHTASTACQDYINFLTDSDIYISLSSPPSPLCPDLLCVDDFLMPT